MGRFPVLWLCGPSGVGKSTVGWLAHKRLAGTGYVDTDQLGLCYPESADDPGNHRVKSRNLGAVLPTFRKAGARAVIVSGVLENEGTAKLYADALGEVALTLCRLRTSHAELRARIEARGWMTHLADESVREADELDRMDFADMCVETAGRPAVEVARLVGERWVW